VVLRIARPYDALAYYGCGPHENYVDRRQAADVGVWSASVKYQYIPYPRPQETGAKTEVRWLSLTDADGDGLLVVSKEPLTFSALHYTAADLDQASHTAELKPREEVILSLDAKHSGLGNGSCGPGVLPCYETPAAPVELHLRFQRCPTGSASEISQAVYLKYID
jgi:beta-galactosidase